MNRYLILRLAGPMQFWGLPTFEGTRPTAAFPTRSGLLGLLGACLGIRRNNKDSLQSLRTAYVLLSAVTRKWLIATR